MKKFFKDNSHSIVRLVVFQLGVMIMGLTTSLATAGMDAKWVYPASSVFCVVFYLFLIYTVGYENGQKDGIRIESGRMKKKPFTFFLVGLVANSLNLLLGILALVFRLIIHAPLTGVLVDVYSPEWAYSLQEVCAIIARFIQAMYLGIIQSISDRSVVMLVLIPLPAIIVSGVSYLLGIRFKDGFLPKKKKQNETKRYS